MFARNKIPAAVLGGRLPKASSLICVDCGEQAARYDHRDYRKPFEVDAVCHRCDNRRGQGLPDINGPHVWIDWKTRKSPSKCGECNCPRYSNCSDQIKNGIEARQKAYDRFIGKAA